LALFLYKNCDLHQPFNPLEACSLDTFLIPDRKQIADTLLVMNRIVPELLCTDIAVTKRFYLDVLGFDIRYERPEEMFAYLLFAGADVMVEQVSGPGRKWITGDLQRPFGRGVNLQFDITDVAALYERVQKRALKSIYLALEERRYARTTDTVIVRQFIAQDPDGYLLRFAEQAK
jgi:catechol 2,3-dioxygenase-like lactoylglutathione lyase family enzyme